MNWCSPLSASWLAPGTKLFLSPSLPHLMDFIVLNGDKPFPPLGYFLNQLSGPTMRNVTKMHVRRASTCLCEVWLLILSLPANCHLIQGILLSPCEHLCSCLEKGGVGLRGSHSSGSFGNRPLERMGLLSNVLTSTDFLLLLPFDPSKHTCTRAVIVPRWKWDLRPPFLFKLLGIGSFLWGKGNLNPLGILFV